MTSDGKLIHVPPVNVRWDDKIHRHNAVIMKMEIRLSKLSWFNNKTLFNLYWFGQIWGRARRPRLHPLTLTRARFYSVIGWLEWRGINLCGTKTPDDKQPPTIWHTHQYMELGTSLFCGAQTGTAEGGWKRRLTGRGSPPERFLSRRRGGFTRWTSGMEPHDRGVRTETAGGRPTCCIFSRHPP